MAGIEQSEFFVPLVDVDKQEEAYAELARVVGSPVPPAGQRVRSITFQHDGVEWTATVGGKLHGTQYVTVRSKGQRVERKRLHSDNATVLAIFPGYPWHVWHDNNRSYWERLPNRLTTTVWRAPGPDFPNFRSEPLADFGPEARPMSGRRQHRTRSKSKRLAPARPPKMETRLAAYDRDLGL